MPDNNENGDGNLGEGAVGEAFEGARLNLDELKRPDGILTTMNTGGQGGVLHRLITAEKDALAYRQELKTAFFLSENQVDNFLAAVSEAKRYGCSLDPLHDWLIAHSAGIKGGRFRAILETLSHTTVTTNYTGKEGKRWWRNNDKNKTSPLT